MLTQDWHTPGHISFASSHPGKKPFETTSLPYGTQVLWPDHCVQGTEGAALHKDLKIPHAELDHPQGLPQAHGLLLGVLRGRRQDADRAHRLPARPRPQQVFLVGLATDFCVGWSALDARKAGFGAVVIEDACRGIDVNGSLAKAWTDMQGAGVKRLQSADLDV